MANSLYPPLAGLKTRLDRRRALGAGAALLAAVLLALAAVLVPQSLQAQQQPTITLSTDTMAVLEGDSGWKDITVVLTLSHPAPEDILFQVNHATNSGTARGVDHNGCGYPDGWRIPMHSDWCIRSSFVRVAKGETEGAATIGIFGDTRKEADETIELMGYAMSPTYYHWQYYVQKKLVLTILDDDGVGATTSGQARPSQPTNINVTFTSDGKAKAAWASGGSGAQGECETTKYYVWLYRGGYKIDNDNGRLDWKSAYMQGWRLVTWGRVVEVQEAPHGAGWVEQENPTWTFEQEMESGWQYTLIINAFGDDEQCHPHGSGSVEYWFTPEDPDLTAAVVLRIVGVKPAPETDDAQGQPTATPEPTGNLEIITPTPEPEDQGEQRDATPEPTATPTPTKAQEIRVSTAGSSATITWDAAPAGSGSGCAPADPQQYRYTVRNLSRDKANWTVAKKVITSSRSVTLDNLVAGSKYWIIIKTYSAECDQWINGKVARAKWKQ